MYIPASDSASNIPDSPSIGKNKENSTPKFSFGEYEKKETQEEVQKQTNIAAFSNQSAAYSIAKAQAQKIADTFETELLGVTLKANPSYKKALMDAFEQMDVEQFKKVTTELHSRYEIDMEELKKQIPENLQVSDAMLYGFDQYERYQFSNPDKVFGMFDKMIEQANTLQRLTGEDQGELIDGINKVISAYTQNLTLS